MKEYVAWTNMIKRCVLQKFKWYSGDILSDDFKYFTDYLNCIQNLKGYDKFMNEGWNLDSDLIAGRKYYSKGTVCFIPPEINTFITCNSKKPSDSGMPLGVAEVESGRYIARAHRIHLGTYDTVDEAQSVYRDFVLNKAKTLAEKFRDDIEGIVYEKLLSFDIH